MILTELELHNFVVYGEHQVINFRDKNSIFIMGKNNDLEGLDVNGVGKTLLAEAIPYALTGNMSRKILVEDLVRKNADKAYVILRGTQGNDVVEIKRGHTGSSPILEFKVNGETEGWTQRTPSLTHDAIMEYFGLSGTPKEVFDDLYNTVFLTDKSVDLFASDAYKSSDRFKFISRLLQAEKWVNMKDRAKKIRDEWLGKHEQIESDIEVLSEEYDESKIDNLQRDIKYFKEGIEQRKEEINEYKEKIKKINENKELTKDIATIKSQINSVKEEMNPILSNLKSDYSDAKEQLQVYNEAKKVDKPEETTKKIEKEIESIQTNINSLESDKSTHNIEITNLRKDIEKIDSAIDGLSLHGSEMACPACGENLILKDDELIKDSHTNRESKIEEYKNEKEELVEKIIEYDNTIESLNNKIKSLENDKKEKISEKREIEIAEKAYESAQSKLELLSDAPEKVKKLKSRIQQLTQETNEKIKNLREELNEKQEILDQLDISEDDTTEYYENQIESAQDSISDYKIEINSLEKEITDLQDMKKELEKKKENLEDIKYEIEKYAFWMDGFIEIRRLLIESFRPSFNETANKIIRDMNYPVTIDMSTTRKTQKGDLREEFNISIIDNYGKERVIDNFSGGERKRLGIAIATALHLTLQQMREKETFKFFIFDEVMDKLDATGIENFVKAIQKIDELKMFISHNQEVRRYFRSTILAEKTNGITTIIDGY